LGVKKKGRGKGLHKLGRKDTIAGDIERKGAKNLIKEKGGSSPKLGKFNQEKEVLQQSK